MKPAPLVGRNGSETQTIVHIGNASVGGQDLFIVGGPCAVENAAQLAAIADHLGPSPSQPGQIQALRGGIYKPRTSPYDFQGVGSPGLDIIKRISQQSGLPFVTEVMAVAQIEALVDHADVLQVGSRNMQNFDLLRALGQVNRPVLLKRGLAATIEELIMAAEYIASHGNSNVILCERGIRSFDGYTRNVLDLGAVVALKQLTHLPVIVDPSHAAGRRELVASLSRAAIAAGADGLIIECHPSPDEAISDAQQTISLDAVAALVESLGPIAEAVGRRLATAKSAPAQRQLVAV
ncbi:MAG: 3-deoxy-7-phosphoheptulonate synthase [Synechococcales cyanobacterium RM1_1_8]|nr:3-deoxy-7-phosphoheptulonate synthase [Synechococcales cyanobacterium RM1_1_8]